MSCELKKWCLLFATAVLVLCSFCFFAINKASAEIEINLNMQAGASIRIAETTDEMGIRFGAVLSDDDKKALETAYGAENVSYGFFIMPDYYISQNGDLTEQNCFGEDAVYTWSGKEDAHGSHTILHKGDCNPVQDGDSWLINGSIIGVKPQNLVINFTSRMYIKCNTGSDFDYYFSDAHTGDVSMVTVALKAKPDYEDDDDMLGMLDHYVSTYVNYYKEQHEGTEPTYSYTISVSVDDGDPVASVVAGNRIGDEVSIDFDGAVDIAEDNEITAEHGFYTKSSAGSSAVIYPNYNNVITYSIGKRVKLATPTLTSFSLREDKSAYNFEWTEIDNAVRYDISFDGGTTYVDRSANRYENLGLYSLDWANLRIKARANPYSVASQEGFVDSDEYIITPATDIYLKETSVDLYTDTTVAGNANAINSSFTPYVVLNINDNEIDISNSVFWKERTNGATVTGIVDSDINTTRLITVTGKSAGTAILRAPDIAWTENLGACTVNVVKAISSKSDLDTLASAYKNGNTALWAGSYGLTNDIDYNGAYLMPIAADSLGARAYLSSSYTWGIFGQLNGDSRTYFTGKIDGFGHKIENAVIPCGTQLDNTNKIIAANNFIGRMDGGTLKNIAFINLQFETPDDIKDPDMYEGLKDKSDANISMASFVKTHAGLHKNYFHSVDSGIVGYMSRGTIDNVYVDTVMKYSKPVRWTSTDNGVLVAVCDNVNTIRITNNVIKVAYDGNLLINADAYDAAPGSGAFIGKNDLSADNLSTCLSGNIVLTYSDVSKGLIYIRSNTPNNASEKQSYMKHALYSYWVAWGVDGNSTDLLTDDMVKVYDIDDTAANTVLTSAQLAMLGLD